jgi:hypothetical protein
VRVRVRACVAVCVRVRCTPTDSDMRVVQQRRPLGTAAGQAYGTGGQGWRRAWHGHLKLRFSCSCAGRCRHLSTCACVCVCVSRCATAAQTTRCSTTRRALCTISMRALSRR